MKTAFWIWKWAENERPAHPRMMVRGFRAGRLPSVAAPFKAAGILRRVRAIVRQHQRRSELLARTDGEGRTISILIRGETEQFSRLRDRLLQAVWKEELSLFNETENRLESLPKQNVIEAEGRPQSLDVSPALLGGHLKRLNHKRGHRWLAFYDGDGNMFQIWEHERRYIVEWQILRQRDFSTHRIWVAGSRPRQDLQVLMGGREDGVISFAHEALGASDVLRLWRAFIRRPTMRPREFLWREITRGLEKVEEPKRERHTWQKPKR